MDISIPLWISVNKLYIYSKSGLYLALIGEQISMSLILILAKFSLMGFLVKGLIISMVPSSWDLTTPIIS